MGEKSNRQQFVELEYVIQKYYNEHCASYISKEAQKFREAQEKDRDAAMAHSIMRYGASMGVPDDRKVEVRTTDSFLKGLKDKYQNDKTFLGDVDVLTEAWKRTAISTMGEEEYNRVSAQVDGGDLATCYIKNRFDMMIMDQLAKSRVPTGTWDYISRKGVSDFLLGSYDGRTKLERELDEKAFDMYHPSIASRVAAGGLSVGLDALVLAPLSAVGGSIWGRGVAAAAKGSAYSGTRIGFSVGLDQATKKGSEALGKQAVKTVAGKVAVPVGITVGAGFLSSCSDATEKDKVISEIVTRDSEAFDGIRQESRHVKSSQSEVAHAVNDLLNSKVKLYDYHRAYSPSEMKHLRSQLSAMADGNLQKNHDLIVETFKLSGITTKDVGVPEWMKSKSEKECLEMSQYYAATAMEMKLCGSKEVKRRDGKTVTLDYASQCAVDYARAASEVRKVSEARAAEEARTVQTAASQQQSAGTQAFGGPVGGQQGAAVSADGQNTAGWGSTLNQLGLGGFGDIGRNIGYVMSMLPDMLIAMFTGKTKNLKFADNMMPIAAIVMGMFVQNPMLKMLFIGLGGANLLNKAGKEILDDGRARQEGMVRQYRSYPDEELDLRIKNPQMRGCTLICDIDNNPQVLNINPNAAEAYAKGLVPLNTLCNAALRDWDEQHQELQESYDRQVDADQKIELTHGIK